MNVTYLINQQQLEENYHSFSKFGKVYFPVKTNHNKKILKILQKLGSGFECDSLDHIKRIYQRKNAQSIIFSNVAKRREDIMWCINHKVNFFTVDDIETLSFIIFYAKQRKLNQLQINVRLNVFDIFKEEFTKKKVIDSRLGASVSTCKKLLNYINAQKDIQIQKGISFYVQAEVHNNDNILIDVFQFIEKNFSEDDNLNFINIGGGSSVKRLKDSLEKISPVMKSLNIEKIILEPGRWLVDQIEDVFIPIRRVVDTDLNEGEKLVSLDIGIYHGFNDILLHKRKFDIGIKNKEKVVLLEPWDQKSKKLVLRGPTADSLDVIGIYNLPKINIDENTIFCAKNIGAYFEVFHSDFSGKIPLVYKVNKK